MALRGGLHQRLQDLPDLLDHSTSVHADTCVHEGKAHDVILTAVRGFR